MEKERKCKICNKRLSIYNYSDQCFHHGESKDLNGVVANSFLPKCTSRICIGSQIVDYDYNGKFDYD